MSELLCRDCCEARGDDPLATGKVDFCPGCGDLKMLCAPSPAGEIDALLAMGWNVIVLLSGEGDKQEGEP